MQRLLFRIMLCLSAQIWAIGLFVEIDSKVTNNLSQPVDIMCQVSNPTSECYGGPCVWISWPEAKIAPGETKSVPLWIGRMNKSQMLLTFMTSVDADYSSTSDYTSAQLKSLETEHVGEMAIEYDLIKGEIFGLSQKGNLYYSLDYQSGHKLDVTLG